MLLWARDDPFFPNKHAERIAELVPDGRRVDRGLEGVRRGSAGAERASAIADFMAERTQKAAGRPAWMIMSRTARSACRRPGRPSAGRRHRCARNAVDTVGRRPSPACARAPCCPGAVAAPVCTGAAAGVYAHAAAGGRHGADRARAAGGWAQWQLLDNGSWAARRAHARPAGRSATARQASWSTRCARHLSGLPRPSSGLVRVSDELDSERSKPRLASRRRGALRARAPDRGGQRGQRRDVVTLDLAADHPLGRPRAEHPGQRLPVGARRSRSPGDQVRGARRAADRLSQVAVVLLIAAPLVLLYSVAAATAGTPRSRSMGVGRRRRGSSCRRGRRRRARGRGSHTQRSGPRRVAAWSVGTSTLAWSSGRRGDSRRPQRRSAALALTAPCSSQRGGQGRCGWRDSSPTGKLPATQTRRVCQFTP